MIKFFWISLAILLAAPGFGWAAGKPLVYEIVPTEDRNTLGFQFISQNLEAALADNYQVVKLKETPTYIRPKLIAGTLVNRAQSETGETLVGYVMIAYVVGEDGKTHGAVVLSSSDPRLNATALRATETWRFESAMMNGSAVATSAVQSFYFKDDVHPAGFAMSRLVLYQESATLQSRLPKVDDLADYVKRLDDRAQRYWISNTVPESLQVVVAVRPGNRSRIWFISSQQSDNGHLEALRQVLESVPAPSVQDGPVAFNIVAKIAGGDGKDPLVGSILDMPQEWHDAAYRLKTGSTTPGIDAILNAVWPDIPSV